MIFDVKYAYKIKKYKVHTDGLLYFIDTRGYLSLWGHISELIRCKSDWPILYKAYIDALALEQAKHAVDVF